MSLWPPMLPAIVLGRRVNHGSNSGHATRASTEAMYAPRPTAPLRGRGGLPPFPQSLKSQRPQRRRQGSGAGTSCLWWVFCAVLIIIFCYFMPSAHGKQLGFFSAFYTVVCVYAMCNIYIYLSSYCMFSTFFWPLPALCASLKQLLYVLMRRTLNRQH